MKKGECYGLSFFTCSDSDTNDVVNGRGEELLKGKGPMTTACP